MNHTTTLETARKLKEAGVNFKNSLFDYDEVGDAPQYHSVQGGKCYPSPILTELLEVLPKAIDGECLGMYYDFDTDKWVFEYDTSGFVFSHSNPCEAAAELLLKLVENKIPLAK